ncbi:MAG TPA: type II toxin-antitoxin system VapC family toxin [Candidatus Dormibacteraeota bacterium]|nr:type II toxin-antitoxin system VapC family toxin [Candidatus Dormibacteraeota bacterium]
MILDSSAVVAVMRQEPEASHFTRAIELSQPCRISAVSYVEASIIVDRSDDPIALRRFEEFFRVSRIIVESVTARQAEIARQAYRDFGKGRHKAGLNLGDCFAYALAKEMDEPLLFKGKDFKHTDIEAAEF